MGTSGCSRAHMTLAWNSFRAGKRQGNTVLALRAVEKSSSLDLAVFQTWKCPKSPPWNCGQPHSHLAPETTGCRWSRCLQARGAHGPHSMGQLHNPSLCTTRFVSLLHSIEVKCASPTPSVTSPQMETRFTSPHHRGEVHSLPPPPGPLGSRCPLISPLDKEEEPTPSCGKMWPFPSCVNADERRS